MNTHARTNAQIHKYSSACSLCCVVAPKGRTLLQHQRSRCDEGTAIVVVVVVVVVVEEEEEEEEEEELLLFNL